MITPVHVVVHHQDQQLHHPQQQLQHPQLDVVLPNGPMTNGVMMKTTMLNAIGMVELVVTMTLLDGTHTVQIVNVLIPMLEVVLPLQHQLLLQHQLTVDLPNGLLTNGVMMKTTMRVAIGMVELVVTMTLLDGTHIVQLVNVLIPMLDLPQQLPQQQQLLQPLQQQLQLQQESVDLHNGLLINGVMMKTTMLIAIGMVELVVTMTLVDGTHIVQLVNALIQMLDLQLPQQQQLQQQLLLQPQLQLQQVYVDLHNGPLINGVMMKTTMLVAIGMVGLVVTMTLVDGTHIAQLVNVLIPTTKEVQPLLVLLL